jgi:hypothetical protein
MVSFHHKQDQNEKEADTRVEEQNKGRQFGTGMFRYRTEMSDAGMSMPAASALMQILSIDITNKYTKFIL